MPIATPFKSIVTGAAAVLTVVAALTVSTAGFASASAYDEEELSYAIPVEYDVAYDCATTYDFADWAGVRAGARCNGYYDNPAGEFVLFSSSTELYYRFGNVVTNNGATCHDGAGQTNWFAENDPSVTLGQVSCVIEDDGTPAIVWTDDRTTTLNYVASDSHTSYDLYVWWRNAVV